MIISFVKLDILTFLDHIGNLTVELILASAEVLIMMMMMMMMMMMIGDRPEFWPKLGYFLVKITYCNLTHFLSEKL